MMVPAFCGTDPILPLPHHTANVLARLAPGPAQPGCDGIEVGSDGLSRAVTRQRVECQDSHVSWDGTRLGITFIADGGQVQWLCDGLGLPGDWSAYDALEIQVVNGPSALRLHAVVVGRHGRLPIVRELAPGQRRTLVIDLDDLPLAQSKHAPYSPVGLRLQAQWGDTWPSEGAWLFANRSWPATAGNASASLAVERIELVARARSGLPPVLDRYGQRLRGDWPTKIRCDQDLERRKDEERAWMLAHPTPAGRDRFGGWLGGPRFAAGGFFRVERDSRGRWWYVTPDGNPFWSFGVCCVNPGDLTVVTGREHLFAELPPRQGPLAGAWGTAVIGDIINRPDLEAVSFPKRNILAKWGGLDAWYEHNLQRISSLGMNTVACWSAAEAVYRQLGLPVDDN